MRILFSLSLLALSGCTYYESRFTQQQSPPESVSGRKAFEKTVYPFVRSRCVACHGQNQNPLFAQGDSASAYRLALSLVDFSDPDKSVFVFRTRNGHCGDNCRTDGTEMRSAIEEWWKQGQKGDTDPTPEKPPIPRTAELEVPADAPAAYRSYRWSLDSFGPEFRGAIFQLEIAQPMPGLYRYRAPRLVTADRTLRVKGPRVYFSGLWDSAADTYRNVDAVVNAQSDPVLAGETGQFTALTKEAVRVAVEFPEIHPAPGAHCRNFVGFQRSVQPLFAARCLSCHQKGGTAARYFLDGNTQDQCEQTRLRANLKTVEASPIVGYPYLKRNDHPIKALGSIEVDSVLDWLRSEQDPAASTSVLP